jgi:hypothetical protein
MLSTILTLALISQTPAPDDSHARIDTKIFDLLWKAGNRGYLLTRDRKELEQLRRLHPDCYESLKKNCDAIIRTRRAQAAAAAAAAQKKADDDYRAMLPFIQEAQRQQLERMSAMERNMALHRMAAAAEYEAQTNKQRADALQWWLMQNRPK